MKRCIAILLMAACVCGHGQPPPVNLRHEQQLENIAERDDVVIEDDFFPEQLEIFRKHPINLNTARQDELQLLQLLNAMQVNALLQYRALLGKFIHIYELQAIPYWDILTIQKILPYITINEEPAVTSHIASALRRGAGNLVFRVSRPVKKAGGFADTGSNRFMGSPEKLFVRYRYSYKNELQFGMLADKDAGEQVAWRRGQPGFDFYSFHFFVRKHGLIRSLAIGDFTVNMGQGLIQWQGLAFGKGELTAIKRQSAILRPYSSAGEFNFHRGVGIQLAKNQFQLAAFGSYRKLDANLSADSLNGHVISSFLTSGLHRTEKEWAERNNIYQQAAGCSFSVATARGHVAFNMVQYRFSHPVLKRGEPYNLFSFRGKRFRAYSLAYDHTFRNLHLFGEFAADHRLNKALINGFLLSMHRRMDISVLVRHLESGFQPFQANAFTENSMPSNESGIFVGLGWRPFGRWKLDAYADVFRFPWLKSRADAPSGGTEYQVQLGFQPRRSLELTSRFRTRITQTNNSGDGTPLHFFAQVPKTNWRVHVHWQPAPGWQVGQRMEMVWFGQPDVSEQGYLLFTDVRYAPANRPYSLGGRAQLFETDGFNSRIYAFEHDAPYAVPAVYHKGIRYYFNLQLEVGKGYFKRLPRNFPRINIWLRWSDVLAEMQMGTAFDVKSPEYKIQVAVWWF